MTTLLGDVVLLADVPRYAVRARLEGKPTWDTDNCRLGR